MKTSRVRRPMKSEVPKGLEPLTPRFMASNLPDILVRQLFVSAGKRFPRCGGMPSLYVEIPDSLRMVLGMM